MVDADDESEIRLGVPVGKMPFFNPYIAEYQGRRGYPAVILFLTGGIKLKIGGSGPIKFHDYSRFNKNQVGEIKFSDDHG